MLIYRIGPRAHSFFICCLTKFFGFKTVEHFAITYFTRPKIHEAAKKEALTSRLIRSVSAKMILSDEGARRRS